jgi:predicted nucleotidyltransferase
MSSISLDFSRVVDLGRHAQVVADVVAEASALGIEVLIAGAFARDPHLHYVHRIPIARQTEDIDFGLAVSDWASFEALRRRLTANCGFSAIGSALHKMRHPGGFPVDLVPFAGVESVRREIRWPPDGAEVMSVIGFREALAGAVSMTLPAGVTVPVVSVPALVMMKLIAWQDRHYKSPLKDAQDLTLLVSNYLDMGNQERLWSEFAAWSDEPDYDLLRLGPRMLGIDVARQAGSEGHAYLIDIVARQADPGDPSLLAREMLPHDPVRAALMLSGILEGLTGSKI